MYEKQNTTMGDSEVDGTYSSESKHEETLANLSLIKLPRAVALIIRFVVYFFLLYLLINWY